MKGNDGFAFIKNGFPNDGGEEFFFKNLLRPDYVDKKWMNGDTVNGVSGQNIQEWVLKK